MKKIIYRKNKLFTIDKSQLKEEAKKEDVCNGLYAAIYLEFKGANKNPKYKQKNPKTLLDQVNQFANEWLKKRGLL